MQQVGKYQVVRRLAAGGMGEVFLGWQTGVAGFERPVVLKTMHPELASQEKFVTQFLDEARVVASLNHPGVVAIYDIEQWEGGYVLALEYIAGVTLAQLLGACSRQGRQVPLPVAARVAHDAAVALDHVHNARTPAGQPANIVHRDVSPQNIMLRHDGITKVVDFGVARAAQRLTHSETGEIKGKFAYMAPEQISAGEVDARTDQYALGVVLWELCAGRRLYRADSPVEVFQLITGAERPPLPELRRDLPLSLGSIVERMLATEPEQRFASCREAATALARFLAQQPQPTGEPEVARFVTEVAADLIEQPTRESAPPTSPATLAMELTAATTPMRSPARALAPAPDVAAPSASPGHPSARWRRLPWLAALAAALLSVVVTLWWWQGPSSGAAPGAAVRAAVFPLRVLNKDPRAGTLGRGASERLISRLHSMAGVKLVSHANLRALAQQKGLTALDQLEEDVALDLARAVSASHAVVGTVHLFGYDANLNLRVLDTRNGTLILAVSRQGPTATIHALSDALADAVSPTLGGTLPVPSGAGEDSGPPP